MFDGDKEAIKYYRKYTTCNINYFYSIYKLLKDKGIKADIVAGLSLGEYSALYASSALDFETCVILG